MTRISPEDPRLTAYALGELDAAERGRIEEALRHDPEARAIVEQTRALARELGAALASEPELDIVQAVGPVVGAETAGAAGAADYTTGPGTSYDRSRSKLLRFPQLYFVIGSAAAACVAVFIAFQKEKPPVQQHYYQVVDLRSWPTAKLTPAANAVATEASAKTSEAKSAESAPARRPALVFSDQLPEGNSAGLLQETKSPAWAATPMRNVAAMTFGASVAGRRTVLASADASGSIALGVSKVGLKRETAVSVGGGTAGTASAEDAGAPRAYYFAPDEKFVMPAVPRYAPAAPRPRFALPSPFHGYSNEASPFGLKAKPFAFTPPGAEVPQLNFATPDLDAVIRRGAPVAPFGRFDLLPGPVRGRHAGEPAVRGEAYAYLPDAPFVSTESNASSTFGVDVDTASYANIRRFIEKGTLPPVDAVRIEELLNAFTFEDANAPTVPAGRAPALAVAVENAEAPWATGHQLVRIGLTARDLGAAERPAADLVLLVDNSASMGSPDKLPLAKRALRTLLAHLRSDDRVALVTCGAGASLVLPSTFVGDGHVITEALEKLDSEGSTNGALGLQLAYDIAKANTRPGSLSRVVLCTDGDFNGAGASDGELTRLVAAKARDGILLSAIGFGSGNYRDATLESLADHGGGNYAYIDSAAEADKRLGEQVDRLLVPVAGDVTVRVDFDPARVASYRLIGYEGRGTAASDANGGDMGAGQGVTALYEITPRADDVAASADRRAWLRLNVTYTDELAHSHEQVHAALTDMNRRFEAASADFKFAAAVAQYGMILRNSHHRGTASLSDVIAWATAGSRGHTHERQQFIDLARRTQALLR